MDIERLRGFCLGLPYTTEDVKWGADLCFSIGGKMFCVTEMEKPVFKASFKVNDLEFDEMCLREGIRPADYVARYKWITVEDAAALTEVEWQHYVRQSYELVKSKLPKKVSARFG